MFKEGQQIGLYTLIRKLRIKGGRIYANTETCLDPTDIVGLYVHEGMSGSKKGRTQYLLQSSKLIEK